MESYKSYMPYSFPALGAFERPRASTLGGHTAVFKALKASTGTGQGGRVQVTALLGTRGSVPQHRPRSLLAL